MSAPKLSIQCEVFVIDFERRKEFEQCRPDILTKKSHAVFGCSVTPKYSAERNVGMSWRRTADQILRARHEGMLTYFFLGESRTDSNDINYIALYNAYIGEMTPTKGIQFFAFTLALFLLLRQALVAIHEC